jgi:glutaredoxin
VYTWKDANGGIHYGDKPKGITTAKEVKVEIFNSYSDSSFLPIKTALANKKVVMFSASWCTYCKKAANYFTQNNISFIELDVENDGEARTYFNAVGGEGIPVILYKNSKITGFSIEQFKKIYP